MRTLFRTVAALLLWPGYGSSPQASEFGGELENLAPNLEVRSYSVKLNEQACTELLEDLRTWRHIEILRPIATADRVDSPTLKMHLGHCIPTELATWHEIEPRWVEKFETMAPAEQAGFGIPFIMKTGFRVYRAEIEGDLESRNDLLFYGGGATAWGKDSPFTQARFRVIDIENCTVRNSANTCDPTTKRGCFAGLARHRSRTYIFEGEHFPKEALYGVSFKRWNYSETTKINFFSTACHFVARDR